jgi:hypothetical protein
VRRHVASGRAAALNTDLSLLSSLLRGLPFLRGHKPPGAGTGAQRDRGGRSTPAAALIVSGADAGYFPFLQELWLSYAESGADAIADFGVLDLGLEADQRSWLHARNVVLVAPDWPYADEGVTSKPGWFKAMVCRPFLPELFPGHAFVFWIDADSWIQDAHALTLFIDGAKRDGFSVVPAVDRAYHPDFYGGGWFLEWQKTCLRNGFGEALAEQLYRYPIISAGAICGASQAPHWKLWQDNTAVALKRAVFREVEQTALFVTVHRGKLPVHFLPSHAHWVCNMCLPAIDVARGIFVEPYQPYTPIGIMGLAADTKTSAFDLPTTDGNKVSSKLRFGSLRSAKAAAPRD